MVKPFIKIGVLDIQGSVKEHFDALKKLNKSFKKISAEPVLVKNVSDLDEVAGLIIPGGESTAIGKLMKKYGLRNGIIMRAKNGMPVWGTCAGAILLAKTVLSNGIEDKKVENLGLMDIVVERNAYGRQMDSFEAEIDAGNRMNLSAGGRGLILPKKKMAGLTRQKISAVFIRAPKIVKIGKNVKILAKFKNEIVAMRENNLLATTFHPEITEKFALHSYFVKMCERAI